MGYTLNVTGFFCRNPDYFSNILINGNSEYVVLDGDVNTAIITLHINDVIPNIGLIDIDFVVNNTKLRKSINKPNSNTITISCELKIKLNDTIKIIGSISGISPTNNYTINTLSDILMCVKTETTQNIIKIKNLYCAFDVNPNSKIIIYSFNRSTSNFGHKLENLNYIIGEKYILSFPSAYTGFIYNKFITENLINIEAINFLSNKIINIKSFDKISNLDCDHYINNALSQLLDCGWWCKGNCDIFTFNYGQLITPYKYGSLQDATGLFVIKLIVNSLINDFDENLFFYYKKMINYIINMQYSNGGIPEYYPLQGGYFNNIPMNDGAYLNYLKILAYMIDNRELIDDQTCDILINCQKKAYTLLKKLQVKINNIPTIWAMQYNSVTLEPAYARTFEPPCLGSLESCQILIYLKEINFTYNNYFDTELQQSYNFGLDWFKNNSIDNLIQVVLYDDHFKPTSLHVYVNTTNVPCRLWARMYDIITSQPMYIDRKSIVYKDLNLLNSERKLGYTWLGNWGEYLLSF